MSQALSSIISALALLLQSGESLHTAPPEPPAAEVNPYHQNGVYLHQQSAAQEEVVQSVIDTLHDVGGTAVVFDVKGYHVYFQTKDATVAEEGDMIMPLYDLPAVVKQLKDAGIYTIARYVAVKDQRFGDVFPETRLSDPVTGRRLPTEWVEPAHPKVLEYNRQVLKEVALSGVDEINLDYIRYPSSFVDTLGQMPLEEKIGNIEKFIFTAKDAIAEAGTETKLGLSTFAILGWHYDINLQTLAQDVIRFAPNVDVISPMAYPQTFSYAGNYYVQGYHPGPRNYWLVYRTLQGYKEMLGDNWYKLRPWIQGYYMSVSEIKDEVRAVYDNDLCGFTVWSAGNYYDNYYGAMRGDMPEQPERCASNSMGPISSLSNE